MKTFWAFEKKPDLDCCACWSLVIAKDIFIRYSQRNFVLVLCMSSWDALSCQEGIVNPPPKGLQKQPSKWSPKQKLVVHG